jgi:hypothetical protein
MPERNTGVAADSRIELRIGINLGDVIVEDDDLYGDGVNIAARVEALADPGGVFVSNTVHDHVRDRLPFVFEDLGEQQVKNIARPVRVYRVRDCGGAARSPASSAQPALPRDLPRHLPSPQDRELTRPRTEIVAMATAPHHDGGERPDRVESSITSEGHAGKVVRSSRPVIVIA